MKLTPMQTRIAKMICLGMTNMDIGVALNKPANTVRMQMYRAMVKNGFTTSQQFMYRCGVEFGEGFAR